MGREERILLLEADVDRLKTIKDFIDKNLDKKIMVSRLANNHNFSVSTLRRHFIHQYQHSVSGYILRSRMDRAMQLLKEQTLSIAQIGRSVGYNKSSSFIHRFTKYYMQSPGYFLRKFASGDS